MVRIFYFFAGHDLRAMFVPKTRRGKVNQALDLMKTQLERLDNMSKQYGFKYSIYLFHPVQDIMRGTYNETLKAISKISPVPVHDTAQLFLDNPRQYYYKIDAHFNPLGSRKIANFLVSMYRKNP